LEAMFTLVWCPRGTGRVQVEGVGLDHVHATRHVTSQNSESGKFEVVNNNCMFKIFEQVATQGCYHVSLTEYWLGWHQSTRCFYPGLPHDEQQESNGGEMQWEERFAAQENSQEKLLHEWYMKVSGT